MYYLNHYVVQWDQVQSFESLKEIIRAMDVAFEPNNPYVMNLLGQGLVSLEPKPQIGFPA